MIEGRFAIGAAGVLAAAVAAGIPAAAATIGSRHDFVETHKVVPLSGGATRPPFGTPAINVGTIDGKIGRSRVHGAERVVTTASGGGASTGRGTEFDLAGSRSFVIHTHGTVASNGQATVMGTGKWTGGTGRYRHAHGTFKINGTFPVSGPEVLHLKGSIFY